MLNEVWIFSFKKLKLIMSSTTFQPICWGLNLLTGMNCAKLNTLRPEQKRFVDIFKLIFLLPRVQLKRREHRFGERLGAKPLSEVGLVYWCTYALLCLYDLSDISCVKIKWWSITFPNISMRSFCVRISITSCQNLQKIISLHDWIHIEHSFSFNYHIT